MAYPMFSADGIDRHTPDCLDERRFHVLAFFWNLCTKQGVGTAGPVENKFQA